MDLEIKQRTEQTMLLDLLDRVVTALERIADLLRANGKRS
jgi:hypothetical protein